MPSRIVVTLDKHERSGLDRLSLDELRDPREQIRFVLRQELQRRGLLPDDAAATVTTSQQEMSHEPHSP